MNGCRRERRAAWLRAGLVAAGDAAARGVGWRGFARLALVVAAIGLLMATSADAQLRKGKARRAKGKTCVECHDKEVGEYKSRASRHEPVRKGDCESCHKRHGVVGILRLQAKDPQLCLSCHALGHEQAAEEEPLGALARTAAKLSFTHPPGKAQRCVTCHDPHGSDAPHLLREEGSGLCLGCHEVSSFRGLSDHDPAETGCLSCHGPHGTEVAPSLRQRPEALCMSCHDGSSEAELAGHASGVPSGPACLGCHAPHASKAPGLMRAHLHAPMEDGPQACETCHEVAEGGVSSFALLEAVPDLCLTCHEDPRDVSVEGAPEDAAVHGALAEGDCLVCHSPHASDQESLLQEAQGNLCGNCHAEAEGARQAKVSHAPAPNECSACHTPHAGGASLLKAPVPGLCMTCHADVKAQLARHNAHPPAADGDCLTCHQPHGSEHKGILAEFPTALCATCHDELQEEFGARFAHAPAVSGQCASCHEPHGSDAEHLVRGDLGQACLGCHQREVERIADGDMHAPFEAGECLACHRPHAAPRDHLLVTDRSLLCRACHQELDGEAGAVSLHVPVERGQCLSCHDPHGGHAPALLRQEDARKLCLGCHQREGQTIVRRDLTIHPPFRRDSCLTCHAPHASQQQVLLAKEPTELCGSCHNVASPAFNMAHNQLITSRTDCTGCHSSHASSNENLTLPVQHEPFAEGACDTCHEEGAS